MNANDFDTLMTTITAGSDLAITKTRSPGGSLVVGDAVTFTLTPTYSGDVPTAVVVTDTIPATYAVGTITAPGWTCTVSGQQVRCTRPAGTAAGAGLPLGPISIAATTISAGTATNTSAITAGGPVDPDPANNSASDGGVTIANPFIDLSVAKSGPNPPLVVDGSTYPFVLSSTNLGNRPFFGTLRITDDLPAGATLTGLTLNGWTCAPAPPLTGPARLTCDRVYTAGSPLGVNQSTPGVRTLVRIDATGPLQNVATNSSPNPNLPDPVPGNDTVRFGVTSAPARTPPTSAC